MLRIVRSMAWLRTCDGNPTLANVLKVLAVLRIDIEFRSRAA